MKDAVDPQPTSVEPNVSKRDENQLGVTQKPKPVYAPALRELLAWLCRSRRRLAIIYFGVLAVWIGVMLYRGDPFWPNDVISPYHPIYIGTERHPYSLITCVSIIAVFCIMQGGFLFGEGKIRVRPGSPKWYRLIVSVVIFSTLMAILCWGFLFAYLELTGRMRLGDRPPESGGQIQWANAGDLVTDSLTIFLSITGAFWIFWLGIGILALRRTDQQGGLGRLVACLLAGSWVEFAVALPIELGGRSRDSDCPCVGGSYLALLVCMPIMIWSIGPGIYLLFLREKKLSRENPHHSRRVLLQKSARAEVTMPTQQ
jgi:hypothetical protein